MTTPLTEAEQAERLARIQDDIRRLFARYRRTDQAPTRFTSSAQRTGARFGREPAARKPVGRDR
jgi:hypothetical protein